MSNLRLIVVIKKSQTQQSVWHIVNSQCYLLLVVVSETFFECFPGLQTDSYDQSYFVISIQYTLLLNGRTFPLQYKC